MSVGWQGSLLCSDVAVIGAGSSCCPGEGAQQMGQDRFRLQDGTGGKVLAGKSGMVTLFWETGGHGMLTLLSSIHPQYQLSSPEVELSYQHVTTCDVCAVTISQIV